MIEETVLNDLIIKNVLKNIYNIDVQSIEKFELGSSNLFKINATQGIYVLKEYESKYDKSDIIREAKVTKYLRDNGIPTSEFIETIDGEFYCQVDNKNISIQKYYEGVTPKPNSASYKQLMVSAEYLGKIVSLLKNKSDFNAKSARNIMTQNVFDETIIRYNQLIEQFKSQKDKNLSNEIVDELEYKKLMLNTLRYNEYVMTKVVNVSISNTHGDYTMMQCLYSESDELIAILDFTSVASNIVAWEVIRAYSYDDSQCIEGKFNVNNFIDYVKHFCHFFPLTKNDLEMMPYVYLIRLLTSTHGYEQYFKNVVKPEILLSFARNRTKICKWLFVNADILSKLLISEIDCGI